MNFHEPYRLAIFNHARYRGVAWLVLVASFCFPIRHATGQLHIPQIVRWEIEATVIDIGDPDGIFSSVRLGDHVQGTLTYDVNSVSYPVWLGLVEMTIENPRTGEDLRFVKDINGLWADVFQYNVPSQALSDNDTLEIVQSVVPPPGYEGEAPIINASFIGPPDALNEGSPLADLSLDRWPIAMLSFYDIHNAFDAETYINAEISSLTPIQASLVPGDFDYDGDVDAVDLFGWMHPYPGSDTVFADADSDGDSDGTDFLIWQRGLSDTPASDAANALHHVAPEASALTMVVVGWITVAALRRLETSS